MSPQSTSRSVRRLMSLAAALLLAALLAIPSNGIALAQDPPGDGIVLVNSDRDFVERKKKGEFVARPIFDQEIETLYYAVRDADTGDWITTMYHVKARAKKLSEGWEYSWEYPALKEQPTSIPRRPSCSSSWRAATVSRGPFTPSSPCTSRADCGTGCWERSIRRAGRGPSPAG